MAQACDNCERIRKTNAAGFDVSGAWREVDYDGHGVFLNTDPEHSHRDKLMFCSWACMADFAGARAAESRAYRDELDPNSLRRVRKTTRLRVEEEN